MITENLESKRLLDGRYEVVAVLGAGASALVYLARHHALHRDVAIKVIRPEVFESEQELERYLREARIIASLNHPNIVTLHDVGKLGDGRPYMVMEFVSGQTLGRLLSANVPLPVDTALAIFGQVARALGHAHRNGIVHRDIKPGNVLLRQRSTGYPMAKVADFGVASVATSQMTHQGAFIGTPLYMSPEQAQGLPVSAASDLYSLGVLMYRSLTGRKPFEADSPIALAMCHVTEPVPPMSDEHLDIPPDLEDIVLRCLEKDPARRFSSADELLEALTEVHMRVAPHLVGLAQDSLDASTSGAFWTLPKEPAPPRNRVPVVLGAALLTLGALGLGVAVGWSARPPSVATPPADPHPMVVEAPPPSAPEPPAPVAEVEVARAPAPASAPAPAAGRPVQAVPPESALEPPIGETAERVRPGQPRRVPGRTPRVPDPEPAAETLAADPESVWGG